MIAAIGARTIAPIVVIVLIIALVVALSVYKRRNP